MFLQCPFIMFYTDSENRAGNHKAMVPQFWWSILVAKDQCALNHSNRVIVTVSSCLIFKVKMATQSNVSEPWGMHPDGICVRMG